MIFEIFPVQSFREQTPAALRLPLLIVNIWGSLIGPYVLHFKQKPSYFVIYSPQALTRET
tara:strand:+ start:103 stop:282 length:180 start_codon:yes stop_codon:yes gene_type:complete